MLSIINQSKNSIMKPKHPAYISVCNSLKDAINNNEFPVDSFLPPEADLEKHYGVSRTTIRRAIEILAQEGYVEVTQGRGTMVLNQSKKQNIGMLSSIYRTLRNNGLAIRPRSVHIDTIPAERKVACALGLPEGSAVLRIQRIQLANEEPISIITNYINPEFVPDFEKDFEDMESLYELLEVRYGIIIDSTYDVISAKAADFMEAELLQVKCGAPLITFERHTYSNRIPQTYDNNIIRADKFQYEIKH